MQSTGSTTLSDAANRTARARALCCRTARRSADTPLRIVVKQRTDGVYHRMRLRRPPGWCCGKGCTTLRCRPWRSSSPHSASCSAGRSWPSECSPTPVWVRQPCRPRCAAYIQAALRLSEQGEVKAKKRKSANIKASWPTPVSAFIVCQRGQCGSNSLIHCASSWDGTGTSPYALVPLGDTLLRG